MPSVMVAPRPDRNPGRLRRVSSAPNTTIELRSPDRTELLRVSSVEAKRGEHAGLGVAVEADVRGFRGRSDAWIDGYALGEFIAVLRDLEARGRGRADLHSMDPDELHLAVSAMDRVGHLLVEFAIARPILVGDRPRPATLRLAGAFELEPSDLPRVVAGFRALASEIGA